MSEKLRLDQALVKWSMAPSRSKAQEMIKSGEVTFGPEGQRRKILNPSFQVLQSDRAQVHIEGEEVLRFVSRAGRKLDQALDHIHYVVKGQRVLDVGQSTGGFTDCLLQRGAAEVVGIDVGTAQLAPSLALDPRVKSFEKMNARQLGEYVELKAFKGTFDLIVIDVSFISQTQVLSQLPQFLKGSGRILSLVKPQFELSKQDLSSKGIVKDHGQFELVQSRIAESFAEQNLQIIEYFESALLGQDGNKEFFAYAKLKGD